MLRRLSMTSLAAIALIKSFWSLQANRVQIALRHLHYAVHWQVSHHATHETLGHEPRIVCRHLQTLPGGATDLSPPIYRWVLGVTANPSPVGTAEGTTFSRLSEGSSSAVEGSCSSGKIRDS